MKIIVKSTKTISFDGYEEDSSGSEGEEREREQDEPIEASKTAAEIIPEVEEQTPEPPVEESPAEVELSIEVVEAESGRDEVDLSVGDEPLALFSEDDAA